MNFRAKALIIAGIYALTGIFIAKKLVFLYIYGQEGINVLPINFFEILLFVLTGLIILLAYLTIFIMAKRSNRRLTGKVIKKLFLSLTIGGILLFYLVYKGYSQWIVPAALLIFGLSILMINRVRKNKWMVLAVAEIVLGTIALIAGSGVWFFLILGFGIFPILYGIVRIKK